MGAQLDIMLCPEMGKQAIGGTGARADPFMQVAIRLGLPPLPRAENTAIGLGEVNRYHSTTTPVILWYHQQCQCRKNFVEFVIPHSVHNVVNASHGLLYL